MKMEQYLAHIDYTLWEVILNGNGEVQMTKDEAGNEVEVPPVTAQQILGRTKERKAKSTLLMAIPDEHLARFHGIKDAKTLWAAIKTKFGEGLDKGYARFQRLISLLEIHEAESTSSTNELNAAYSVSTATGHSSQVQGSSSYANELMFSFFANQSSSPQLDNEDLEQINQDDLEEMDLKWQVVVLFMRVKRFYKRKLEFNGKEPVGFDKTKVECFNCHIKGHFSRDFRTAKNLRNRRRDARNAGYKERDNGKRPVREDGEKALVVQDGLDEALREKEDLKAKLEKFETSSKNLTKPHNSQISAKVKTGLGYDGQFNEKEVLDVKEEEVTETVFDNRLSDEENSLANDRFKKGEGFHAGLPPLTGNYMLPKPDLSFVGLDESIYKFKISETITSLSKDVKYALETSTALVEKPKEVRYSAPLIQEWDTNSDNDIVFRPKHIPAKIDFVKDDRMSKKYVLPNNVGKGTGHRESRPVWNNVQRINHQNQFAPTAVFTRSRRIPVSAAKPKAETFTSDAKPVNTTGPKQSVNFSNSRSTFHKSHSPIRRSFYNATLHSKRNSTERVNIAGSKAVSVVKGNGVTTVKASASCV
nr:hypothetical protein [Tanacetum cinerariifolium]